MDLFNIRKQQLGLPLFLALFAVNILFASCENDFAKHAEHTELQKPTSAPKDIGFNIFENRKIQLKGKFNAQKALFQLFPGNSQTLREGSQSVEVVNWRSANSNPRRFEGMSSPEDEVFPAKEGMTTRFRDTLRYQENGKEFMLLSLSSAYYVENQALIGRISCGFLGMALFQKSADTWSLTSFNPAIGCFGSFSTSPAPQLLKMGKNYGFALDNYIGGGRLPQTCDRIVVGRVKNQFQILFRSDFYERKNAKVSTWKSEIKSKNKNSEFSDLEIITKGKISKADLDEWDIEYLSEELQAQLEKESEFSFELCQNLHFGANGYEIKDEKLKITK